MVLQLELLVGEATRIICWLGEQSFMHAAHKMGGAQFTCRASASIVVLSKL